MSIYDFSAKRLTGGQSESLANYKGQVLLIVNTASKCGFTPQYEGLQNLYTTYKDHGFTVLGFPSNQFGKQEPGNGNDIKNFCKINYGVTFPMFERIDVKGPNIHPLYKYLTEQKRGFITRTVKWNFSKFLIDREGKVVARFAPQTTPDAIADKIEKLLAE